MAVRAVGPEDFDDVVSRVRRLPLSALLAWVLAPAPDLVEARLAYARWLVAGLLRIGVIWIDDDGDLAGGRRLRPRMSDRLRFPHPEHGGLQVVRGAFTYPVVPTACRRRLLDVAATGLRLRSSGRRTFLVQVMGAADAEATTGPLDQLVRHARAERHGCLCIAADPAATERLRLAGFTPGRRAPAGDDGRPALTAWELPA